VGSRGTAARMLQEMYTKRARRALFGQFPC
jgi:hypothetical protein